MVETVVGPSELHLKKELTALQKARFLRDPETCSSWKSPLSSKSYAATSKLKYEKRTRRDRKGMINLDVSCEVPPWSEKRRKKVYLHNWGRRSSKSSDSGMKLDEDNMQGSVQESPNNRQGSAQESPEDRLSNPLRIDSNTNTKTSRRRTSKKSRSAVPRKRVIPNLRDLPSSSLGLLNSFEQSDDTGYSNSEDLRQATQEHTQKIGHASHCASPLSSKILKYSRREGSSSSNTPAVNNFSLRYGGHSYSTIGSWNGTTSFDEDEADQLGQQGCGIPCYGSKRTKYRGCGGGYSPSLSDTLRTKASILCGSRTLYNKRGSSDSHKPKYLSKSSQDLPLLTTSCHRGSSSVGTESVGLSTNFVELDLEALSRLDGVRWSCCRSQEGQELALPGGVDSEMTAHRSLSQKHRPRSFDEIIGQNIVVQSLNNAIIMGRIAPAYIFQGPRGTGKTSTARIFTAALNCLSTEENKPCGICSECTNFATGNGSNMREVDATNKKDIGRLRLLTKNISIAATFSRYNVFVIDECHMLSSKSWSTFTKFLEEPLPRVVLIFITTEPENLPRTIVSRCPKYLFHKIKDSDLICRLRKLSAKENLDVELDALDLIALNSDGSLRDAETMLDQLSLLGKRITTSLVNDLVGVVSDEKVGVVSDEKLLDVLETALSSNIAETVKKSRELMDSGVDPVALMTQLAALIMDIIAGSYHLGNSHYSGRFLSGKNLTEAELEKLQQALRILSDAEKQLRLSSERSTWFTAALLQLGSAPNLEPTVSSSSSSKQSNEKLNVVKLDTVKEASVCKGSNRSLALQDPSVSSIPNIMSGCYRPHDRPSFIMPLRENIVCNLLPRNSISVDRNILDATHKHEATINQVLRCVSPEKLDEIWRSCIERCHSMTLRQLLSAHGKLISIAETEGVLIAYIAFVDGNVKSRAERFLSSITNSFEIVLRHTVEVRIGLSPENYTKAPKPVTNFLSRKHMNMVDSDELNGSSDKDQYRSTSQLPRRSIYYSKGNNGICGTKGRWQGISEQTTLARALDEQRLSDYVGKNLFLAQNGVNDKNQNESSITPSISSKLWQDERNHEIEESSINEESSIKDNDSQSYNKEQIGGSSDLYYYAISPSLLHNNSFKSNFDKEKPGYESRPGWWLCCWKSSSKADRAKMKQRKDARSQKRGRLLCFRQRGSPMQTDFKLRR